MEPFDLEPSQCTYCLVFHLFNSFIFYIYFFCGEQNSGSQTWHQALLSTEPLHWSSCSILFKESRVDFLPLITRTLPASTVDGVMELAHTSSAEQILHLSLSPLSNITVIASHQLWYKYMLYRTIKQHKLGLLSPRYSWQTSTNTSLDTTLYQIALH